MTPRNLKHLAALAAAFTLAGCLGSGSGTNTAGGGIGGTGITASGPVTGFGSVFVSGIEYQVDNTTSITVNGSPNRAQTDLALGMVVSLTGTQNSDGTRHASTIAYSANIKGPTNGPCTPSGQLQVLHQDVSVDAGTRAGSGTIFSCSGLATGTIVEVSGITDASGVLRATRVSAGGTTLPPGELLEVSGTVSNLQVPQRRFNIGTLVVDYSTASPITGSLNDGSRVEVKGDQVTNNVLRAVRVAVESGTVTGQSGGAAEVEGFITSAPTGGAQTFFVTGNILVRYDAGTLFSGGNAANLLFNKRIDVSGTYDSTGAIKARRIEFNP